MPRRLILSASTLALLGAAIIMPVRAVAQPTPRDMAAVDKAAGDKAAGDKAKPFALQGGAIRRDLGADESALRYYVQMKQQARVEAELRRLKQLYPDWQPPANLYEPQTVAAEDEQPLWDLFAANRMDDLEAAIAERKRTEPGWAPSRDLLTKIERRATRIKLMDLWKRGQLAELLTLFAQNEPDEGDVELAWIVAEAHAKTKNAKQSLVVFAGILKTAKQPAQRLATIHKAMAALNMQAVETLIAMGKTDAQGQSEFHPIQTDITRARISAYLHDERQEKIPDKELKDFEEFAKAGSDPNQLGLVGWYKHKNKLFREALDWFKLALQKGGDATIAHGLAHSLRELGRYRETEEVAYAWREPLVNNAILLIDILERDLTMPIPPYIEPERLQRYAQVTMDITSGEGAQALAWYAYNNCQIQTAYEWFQRAVAWSPRQTAVYGLALTARRLKHRKEFVQIVNRHDGLHPLPITLIFPDDKQSLNPCDLLHATERERQRMLERFELWQAQGQDARQRVAKAPPKIDRNEFPVIADPENPLRFSSSGKTQGPSFAKLPVAPAAPGPLAQEPWSKPPPLVARRVLGVGAMPYERYGFDLLPGYTGVNAASSPHMALNAPDNTQWTTTMADDALATTGITTASELRRIGFENVMDMLARAPRVPRPSETRAGGHVADMYRAPGTEAPTTAVMSSGAGPTAVPASVPVSASADQNRKR
jgi:cellulose synthase operon protein C